MLWIFSEKRLVDNVDNIITLVRNGLLQQESRLFSNHLKLPDLIPEKEELKFLFSHFFVVLQKGL